jgi:geranylgeranyl reductase family protein
LSYDVAVVGAGPGGSTAAKECAVKGLNVLLLERNEHAGKKTCAGGLSSLVSDNFDISGVETRELDGTAVVGSKEAGFPEVDVLSVNHNTYRRIWDRHLEDEAVAAGAHFEGKTTVTNVVRLGPGKMELWVRNKSGGEEKRSARAVVLAEGATGRLSYASGLRRGTKSEGGRWPMNGMYQAAQYEYKSSAKVPDLNYMFFGVVPVGYGWVFPKVGGLSVGVCSVASTLATSGHTIREYLDHMVTKHPVAAKLCKDAQLVEVTAAPIPCSGAKTIYGDGVVAVGDTAGMVQPLTAEGIPYAMLSGQTAARVLANAIPEEDLSAARLREYYLNWQHVEGKLLDRQRFYFNLAQPIFNGFLDELVKSMRSNEGLRSLIHDSLGKTEKSQRLKRASFMAHMLGISTKTVLNAALGRNSRDLLWN